MYGPSILSSILYKSGVSKHDFVYTCINYTHNYSISAFFVFLTVSLDGTLYMDREGR